MNPSEGLQVALNEIRETLIQDNKLYQTQIPTVDHYTSSQVYGQSLLALPPDLRNKFIQTLVNRIAYTKFEMDYFENPLRELINDELPLGAIGQDIYINRAEGRVYDINDFAGLLAKYEADVKVEYNEINFDMQYPVTIVRKELEKAFSSWGDFESFLLGLSQSLYNGAYIDEYNYTRRLMTEAYINNSVQMETFSFTNASKPTKDELEELTERLRQAYLDFQNPNSKYNAWSKVGGYGRSIVTWSNPQDIYVFINNKMASKLSVKVLANAFNIDQAQLMGKIKYIPDFDIKDNNGNVIIDGSNIYAFICDKRWFKIREKALYMDEFYNANNRSWQQYLNDIKSFNYSLFANALMLVASAPVIQAGSIVFNDGASVTLTNTTPKVLKITTNPFQATETITFTASSESYVSIEKVDNRNVEVTGVADGTTTITATGGTSGKTATISVITSGLDSVPDTIPDTTPATTPE